MISLNRDYKRDTMIKLIKHVSSQSNPICHGFIPTSRASDLPYLTNYPTVLRTLISHDFQFNIFLSFYL